MIPLFAVTVIVAMVGYFVYKNYLMRQALTAYQSTEFDKALATFNRITRFYPRDAYAYYNRALTYDALNQPQQAINDFDKAIERGARDIKIRVGYGSILAKMKQFDKAQAHFQVAINITPEDPMPHNMLAWLHLTQGQLQVAQDHLEAAQQQLATMNEKDAQFSTYLGDGYGQYVKDQGVFAQLICAAIDARQDNFDAAHDAYKTALEIDPENPDIYNDIGETYFAQGAYDKALENFQQAKHLLEQKPNIRHRQQHQIVNAGLAITQYQLGDTEEAIKQWHALIQEDPIFTDIDDVEHQLNWMDSLVATGQAIIAALPQTIGEQSYEQI
jgi:tetratricopeptide (TPR) repeat protein